MFSITAHQGNTQEHHKGISPEMQPGAVTELWRRRLVFQACPWLPARLAREPAGHEAPRLLNLSLFSCGYTRILICTAASMTMRTVLVAPTRRFLFGRSVASDMLTLPMTNLKIIGEILPGKKVPNWRHSRKRSNSFPWRLYSFMLWLLRWNNHYAKTVKRWIRFRPFTFVEVGTLPFITCDLA